MARPSKSFGLFAAACLLAGCPSPMQENVRVKAAADLACDRGHVDVREIASRSPGPNAPTFTPDTKTYEARGCGRTGRYTCDFAKSKCVRLDG